MKALKFVIVILFPIFMLGQDLFDQANQAYKSEDYQLAIDIYEKIISDGSHSVELYYNLANSYYKLNQIAPSIYNYEKALLLNPNDQDVRNNLKFAQNMMVDSINEVPKIGFNEWLHGFTSVFDYDVWAKISVVFSFLILLSFVCYYFVRKITTKRIFFGFIILFLISSITSIVISLFERELTQSKSQAIVFSESIAVKSEPNQNSTNITLLHEGTKVVILDFLDDYYKVELPDQTVGWLVKKSVKTLNF